MLYRPGTLLFLLLSLCGCDLVKDSGLDLAKILAMLAGGECKFTCPSGKLPNLKGRNFRGKKISRISRSLAKFAKMNSFFEKISIREN